MLRFKLSFSIGFVARKRRGWEGRGGREGGNEERTKGRKRKKEQLYIFLTCEIVSNKRNADVDEIIKPARHDGGTIIGNDFDKLALKELISIKENIISKPCSGSGNQSRTKICKGKSE